LRNDLGLLAEEYDPIAGRQVGNFPQAFSHVSLVNTAAGLSHAETLHPMSHAARIAGIKPDMHMIRRTGSRSKLRRIFHH
jgi:GH15 family glucan-1,4-alpha-glucosidase